MRATHNFVFFAAMCLAIGFWTLVSFQADAGDPIALNAPQTGLLNVNLDGLPVQTFDAI